MEDELISLMALDDDEAKKYRGRSDGPKCVIRNALSEGAAGSRRTTAVSRCWRKMAGWLQDLSGAKCKKEKAEAVRKLLYYRHPPPAKALATQQQQDSFANFEAWKNIIKEDMLGYSVWVETFRCTAIRNAEREERAAQHATMVKWAKWIHEGPAHGLRRQHQYSRVAHGWAPTALSSGITEAIKEEDELEGIEGISIDELNLVRFEQGLAGTPAGAQQEADDEASKWGKHWGTDQECEPLKWPTDMGAPLMDLLVEELVDACLTFPVETGLGWDRWHPRVVARLSRPLQEMLINILLECEEEGMWPNAVELVFDCATS